MSEYSYWLANVPKMTPVKIRHILGVCESAEELYGLSGPALRSIKGLREEDASAIEESRKTWNLTERWMELTERGIGFVSLEDEGYPNAALR